MEHALGAKKTIGVLKMTENGRQSCSMYDSVHETLYVVGSSIMPLSSQIFKSAIL